MKTTPWHTCELDWRVVEDSTDHVIADIRTRGHLGGREVASLIAAAPELLEALKKVDRLASMHQKGAIGEAQAIARKAIAKAEGRA